MPNIQTTDHRSKLTRPVNPWVRGIQILGGGAVGLFASLALLGGAPAGAWALALGGWAVCVFGVFNKKETV